MNRGDPCTIEGCAKPIQSKGLCPMHYQRERKHGSVEHTRRTETDSELAKRFWSKVKRTSDCWLWQAATNHHGYGTFSYRGSTRRAHRVAYELRVGPIPGGMVVDHICHQPGCVRPDHLRLATVKQNAENRAGATRKNKTGIRGVTLYRPTGKWLGRVRHNSVDHQAYFDTPEEAAAFAQAKRQELFTHTIETRQPCKPQS